MGSSTNFLGKTSELSLSKTLFGKARTREELSRGMMAQVPILVLKEDLMNN